ncbi:Protein of unknown function [Pyronema omphalodes CBS 100304]|uniref:Uncharacterized protein n=1 Tax=Pyronema omphalodes (strain CBS 100304) TaxID=1076935 RepID=U4KZK3_PYROM|nr:Protein of unknown function [Pyronema omphalodes CBS 100304]
MKADENMFRPRA